MSSSIFSALATNHCQQSLRKKAVTPMASGRVMFPETVWTGPGTSGCQIVDWQHRGLCRSWRASRAELVGPYRPLAVFCEPLFQVHREACHNTDMGNLLRRAAQGYLLCRQGAMPVLYHTEKVRTQMGREGDQILPGVCWKLFVF